MSRRLLASYLGLTLLVLAVLEVPLGISFAHNERGDLSSKVERDAVAIASIGEGALERNAATAPSALIDLARRYARDTGGRVIVVNARALSIVDSAGALGRSFASRPEIRTALAGNVATGVRRSETLHERLLFVAVPVASGGTVHGAVRITYPLAAVDSRVRRYWLILAAIAGVVLAAASLVGLAAARWISRPLRRLEEAAEAAGAGDLTPRAPDTSGPPEVRAVGLALAETVGNLGRLIESQKTFVADASHQLRTPLTALRLRLENLEHELPQERRPELERVLAEVDRLSRLVDGLLALARADAGTPSVEAIDVERLARERLHAWSALAAERDVELRTAVPPGLAARASSGRLEQVLDNLIANSLDVSPPGAAITVSGHRANGLVELHVVDEGPGMTVEERARAFDRFWRGGSDDTGFGLGLAIVHRLVEADGGSISLEPAARGGLEAIVRLHAATRAT